MAAQKQTDPAARVQRSPVFFSPPPANPAAYGPPGGGEGGFKGYNAGTIPSLVDRFGSSLSLSLRPYYAIR